MRVSWSEVSSRERRLFGELLNARIRAAHFDLFDGRSQESLDEVHDKLFEHVLFSANLIAFKNRCAGDVAGHFAVEVTEDGEAMVQRETRQNSLTRRPADEVGLKPIVRPTSGHARPSATIM